MQVLETPAGLPQLRRKIVEQLGIAGTLAGHAKVVFRSDQALPEIPLPDPVDDHAGDQRVLGGRHPPRQRQAPTRGIHRAVIGIERDAPQDRRRRRKYDIGGLGGVAAGKQARNGRDRRVFEPDVGPRRFGGPRGFDGLDPLVPLAELGRFFVRGFPQNGGVELLFELLDQLLLAVRALLFVLLESEHGFRMVEEAQIFRAAGGFLEQPVENRLPRFADVSLESPDGLIRLFHGRAVSRQFPFGADQAIEIPAVVLGPFEGLEDRQQTVVVLLRERLEFVVVTARAANGQAQEGRGSDAEHVVKLIVAVDPGIGRFIVPSAEAQKRGGDLRLGIGAFEFIARQLLGEETVERLVLLKGLDHVIPVAPGVRLRSVALVTVGFGVANDIEPMAGPTLSVCRAVEQIVDEPVVGLGRFVGQERFRFSGGRGQAGQDEVGAAEPRAAVGGRRRCDAVLLQSRLDEGIDRSFHPPFFRGFGHGRPLGRHEGPMRDTGLGRFGRGGCGGLRFGGRWSRRQSVFDPSPDHDGLICAHLLFAQGHRLVDDAPVEQTGVGRTGGDGRALRAAFDDRFRRAEIKLAHPHLARMAGKAAPSQDGTHVFGEVGNGGNGRNRGRHRQQHYGGNRSHAVLIMQQRTAERKSRNTSARLPAIPARWKPEDRPAAVDGFEAR